MEDTLDSPPPASALDKDIDATINATIVGLRLMFSAWLVHFRSHGYIMESTMDKFDQNTLPKVLELTVRDFKAREAIGNNWFIWDDLRNVLGVAVPSFENRSYTPLDNDTEMYDGPSSNVMVANSATLLKDLQRVDKLLMLARNILSTGEKVQNVAAQQSFDREVCNIVRLCVRVTARGYDGDGTSAEENKWQEVVNGFKKLLITSMQTLSNLITANERLKLMLWVELFDNNIESAAVSHEQSENVSRIEAWERSTESWMSSITKAFLNKTTQSRDAARTSDADKPLEEEKQSRGALPPTSYLLFMHENREKIVSEVDISSDSVSREKEIFNESVRRWRELSEEERATWKAKCEERKGTSHMKLATDFLKNTRRYLSPTDIQKVWIEDAGKVAGRATNIPNTQETVTSPSNFPNLPPPPTPPAADSNYSMTESAEDGAKKLAEGKAELLKRLQNARQSSPRAASSSPLQSPTSPINAYEHQSNFNEEEEEDEEDEESEEAVDSSEEDEEDYALPGEEGRGLLTDVPLILGPNEIEVLPMIIMNGICQRESDEDGQKGILTTENNLSINLYTIRCHLLLAQENGRNLLRELLIFVAAWDLREEELYFKFMVKIIESILMNGLMPFAYSAFKETKDIISPAQAVIMKLLTKIFHSRQAFISQPSQPMPPPQASTSSTSVHSPPLRFDVQIVHFLFTEFRQNIIPQICALIFLQGQIRQGLANVEDFPLNLWDMERMYEGIYQYLEFFAILTDHDNWKQMMADWDVVSELVTLLRELELAIPKGRLTTTMPSPAQPATEDASKHNLRKASTASPTPVEDPVTSPAEPVAVERPYDINAPIPAVDDTAASSPSQPLSPSPYPEPIHDEPADFEWRNLKKLCVLVLSSLVWKNRKLQDQVRNFGGITAILSCCGPIDDHNPYIREHAIMCLRFLLEGNKENQDVVRGLAAEGEGSGIVDLEGHEEAAAGDEDGQRPLRMPVPREVLDSRSYETFMDANGQVGLRRKEGGSRSSAAAVAAGLAQASSSSDPAALAAAVDEMMPEWVKRARI